MSGDDLARAARALVGVPFRLHGRDPATGLDCIGVLEAALGGAVPLPTGYALRSRRLPPLGDWAAKLGLYPAQGSGRPGDVVMLRVGPCQHHLAIAVAPGLYVHAHAGLRRVVEGPLAAGWIVAERWRSSD